MPKGLFTVSMWYVYSCLPSLLSESSPNVLWALPQPSPLAFKIPGFKPHCLQESTKFQALLHSMPIAMGIYFPHELTCVLICLLPFSMTGAPSPQQLPWSVPLSKHVFTFLFSLRWPLLYLFCGVCSANLKGNFWAIHKFQNPETLW